MASVPVVPLQPIEAKALIDELYRREIAAMAAREAEAAPRSEAAADAELARLEAEIAALRRALRLRDAAPACAAVEAAAAALGMAPDAPVLRQAGRPAMGALVETREAEREVEAGSTVEAATRAIRDRRFGGRAVEALKPPVMLSRAIAAAGARAVSRDMAAKIRATGDCLLAHFGEVPLDLLAEASKRVGFLLWLRRLPREHGKRHGRNRYEAEGRTRPKSEEIAEADASDAAFRASVEARADLTLGETRALLAKGLVVRLNDSAIEKHHARMMAIFDAARLDLGWGGPEVSPVLKEYRQQAARGQKRREDPLDLRVTLWIGALRDPRSAPKWDPTPEQKFLAAAWT